ncbi:MAG: DUF6062 family protein [Lachnospiraceae bacterium]
MKEQLYTIPVNEAFDVRCECPVCAMKHKLKENAIEFTLGPSYMEDDIRMVTDKVGFCAEHVKELYGRQNRLGLALMLKTHADKTIQDVERLSKGYKPAKQGLFKKKEEAASPLISYLKQLSGECFVCKKIDEVFERYIVTVFYLYEREEEFRKKLKDCKGFCNEHYRLLLTEAPNRLSANRLEEFSIDLNEVYLDGMRRVRDDLSWFIDKFDYRYTNEPWKNSKDALQRMMTKQNSVFYEENTEQKP